MFCGKCGAVLTPKTKFCHSCGTPVTANEAHNQPSSLIPPQLGAKGQYAAEPLTQNADTLSADNLQKMFLSREGRLNRKPYILRTLGLDAVIFVLFDRFGNVAATLALFVLLFPLYCLDVRRLHDMGRNENLAIGIVVIEILATLASDGDVKGLLLLVDIALFLYLCCTEGTRGPNAYGADPLEWKH